MALRRSALLAVALSAVALLLPVAARADHGVPLLDDGLATYFGIAQAHWGGPLPGCVANGVTVIPVHAVLYDDPVASVAARADQPGCRLWLDRSHWREMAPVEACTIVVHEWGHLVGLGHSHDPLDLMAEFPYRAPPGCTSLDRRSHSARTSARRASACRSSGKHARWVKRGRSAQRGRSVRLACVRPAP